MKVVSEIRIRRFRMGMPYDTSDECIQQEVKMISKQSTIGDPG